MKTLTCFLMLLSAVFTVEGASISGRIVDILTGEPYSKQLVFINGIPDSVTTPLSYLTFTDSTGHYSFPYLPEGEGLYEISTRNLVGYGYPEVFDIDHDTNITGINLKSIMPERDTTAIWGTITLLDCPYNPFYYYIMAFSVTGQLIDFQYFKVNGGGDSVFPYPRSYTMWNLPPVELQMCTFVEGTLPQYYDHVYYADTSPFFVHPFKGEVNFDLEGIVLAADNRMIRGTVRGKFGPLPYASVYAKKGKQIVNGDVSHIDGSYCFYYMPPGTYSIFATKPGYHTAQYAGTVTLADQDVYGIDIKLKPIYDDVEEPAQNPDRVQLLEASPNPFSQNTNIRYSISDAGPTSLRIYDAAGSLVKTLVNEIEQPGEHTVRWDARDSKGMALSSGVYFLRLESKAGMQSGRLLIIK